MSNATLCGIPLKFVSLITLTVQNSLLTILLHYSRTNAAPYSAPAAVLLNELLKGSISFAVALYNSYQQEPTAHSHLPVSAPRSSEDAHKTAMEKRPSHASTLNVAGTDANAWRLRGIDLGIRLRRLRSDILSPDCWKLSIPAILYVIQNNLQFVAASNLDVATFQVSYQMKILTTALFSVILLHRRLSLVKWLSLFFLAVGVAIVQLQAVDASSAKTAHDMDPLTGSMAVAAACLTSGLAGVYFEMVLKGSKADLWVRNVQLSAFSIIPALCPAFFPDFSLKSFLGLAPAPAAPILQDAAQTWMFSGFGFWAWSVVLCQVFGGLVTALVIKFSDNIMKGFATSLSIVLSFIAGIILFDSQLTLGFVLGCSVVLGATYAYNQPDRTVAHGSPTSRAASV